MFRPPAMHKFLRRLLSLSLMVALWTGSLATPLAGTRRTAPLARANRRPDRKSNINRLAGAVVQEAQQAMTSAAPVLVSEATSTRAIALDSVVFLKEPFQLNSPVPWTGIDGFDAPK